MGMRRRLGVARCLLADPELLILDDAGGLDPAGIIEFRQMVRDLAAEGRTVLLSSHLLDEVEKAYDWAAIVDRGHVVAQGPMTDLFAHGPRTIVVRSGAPARAATVIARQPAVQSVQQEDGIVRATLGGAGAAEARAVASGLNQVLVDAGVPVFGIELPRARSPSRAASCCRSTWQSATGPGVTRRSPSACDASTTRARSTCACCSVPSAPTRKRSRPATCSPSHS